MQLTRKLLCILCLMPYYAFAKCGSVNYSWGADSLATMHDYVVTMMLYVLYICYAFAAIVAIYASLQIYIRRLPVHHRSINRFSGLFRIPHIKERNGRNEAKTNTSIKQKSKKE